ncbi:MAG: hypothetical protein L3J87_02870, partial [Thermoplasmata archaeon]|nr:hypothetical protein [Thermoplasmata archaeon]
AAIGTYQFLVLAPAGFVATPGTGSFTVAGEVLLIYLRFDPVTYPVLFQIQCGLIGATGETWSVEVNGVNFSSTFQSIAFQEPNGSYTFVVAPPTGLSLTPSGGTFNVTGATVMVCLGLVLVNPAVYNVLVLESGLATGTRWGVLWGGTLDSATNSWIEENATNGTYSFAVPNVPGYTVAALPLQAVVAGKPLTIGVVFTPLPVPPATANLSVGPPFTWATFGGAVVAASVSALALGYVLGRRRRADPEAPPSADEAGSGTA